jgi:hypothetical protein
MLEQHRLSILLADAFALSYRIDNHSEQTLLLLELYRDARRKLPRHNFGKRYGASEAYAATQGIN